MMVSNEVKPMAIPALSWFLAWALDVSDEQTMALLALGVWVSVLLVSLTAMHTKLRQFGPRYADWPVWEVLAYDVFKGFVITSMVIIGTSSMEASEPALALYRFGGQFKWIGVGLGIVAFGILRVQELHGYHPLQRGMTNGKAS